MIHGSCLCGQCSFEAQGDLYDVLYCHCSICRKLTGSSFAVYGGVSKDRFNWLCEQSSIKVYQSSKNVSRYFCSTCGALIASIDRKEPDTIYLSAGLLDPDIPVIPEYHQYVASKAHWCEISDDLPQFMAESLV